MSKAFFMNMNRQKLVSEGGAQGLKDSPEATVLALTHTINEVLSGFLLTNVPKLSGRDLETVKHRLKTVSGRFRDRLSGLLATGDSTKIVHGILDILSGGEAVAIGNLAKKLPHMSWSSYVSVLENSALVPEDLGLVLEYFIQKCRMTKKDFFVKCPVSQYVGDRLIARGGGQHCLPMEWTPDRLKLRQWMTEQARLRIIPVR